MKKRRKKQQSNNIRVYFVLLIILKNYMYRWICNRPDFFLLSVAIKLIVFLDSFIFIKCLWSFSRMIWLVLHGLILIECRTVVSSYQHRLKHRTIDRSVTFEYNAFVFLFFFFAVVSVFDIFNVSLFYSVIKLARLFFLNQMICNISGAMWQYSI